MLVVLSFAALLFLPGYLALLLAVPADELSLPGITNGPAALLQVALAVGLGAAVLPLALLFTTLVGLSLTPALFAGLLGLLVGVVAWRLWRLRWQPLAAWRDRSQWPALGVFAGLLAVTLGLRMLQVRALVVPAWVDGVHHTMIAQLIAEQGQVPADYRPYLDVGPFIYHFGFHALAAGLSWLTGLAVPQAVLAMGQVLNALVGVGVYGLTVTLVGGPRRSPALAGLVAMGVVGMVSFMPAYYVTWGRYTQLTGLVVLPAAMMLTVWWLETGKRWALVLGGVAVAGMGVTHYRVLVFYGAFVAVLLVYQVVARAIFGARHQDVASSVASRLGPGTSGYFVRAAALAGFALLLLSPWIARVARVLMTRGAWPGLEVGTQYTAVPYDLLLMPRNVLLTLVAAWGFMLGVWRRHRGIILIGLWLLCLVVLAALGSPLVPASAVVIGLFLPVAVLVAYFVSEALIAQMAPRWRPLAGLGLLVVALAGAAGMRSVINPATILLTRDDMRAIAWVRENTAPDARFLINSRLWQGNIYVGTDAGYWLSVLANRATEPPPTLYVLGLPDQVEQTNRISRLMAADRIDPVLLRQTGITHVFVGARGGPIDPAMVLSDPAFELLYTDGGAWVFGLDTGTRTTRRTGASSP